MAHLRNPLVAALLLIGVLMPQTQAARAQAAGDRGPVFAITQLVVPLFVPQNGTKQRRAIYWQGSPTFPVTVYEQGMCPESVNCGTRVAPGSWVTPPAKTVFATRTNPLVSNAFYFCSGGMTANYVIGVEDWLVDAHGQKTAPVRNFWVCKTHN